jgi:RecJ-like exonuclease
MKETFFRRKVTTTYEEVELPKDHKICAVCKGKGLINDYDLGYTSLHHEAAMSALKNCLSCGGLGFYKEVK